MAFAGIRGSGNWGTNERPQNFREMILWMEPNGSSPITALMAKTSKASVNDPQYHWWEETNDIVRVTTTTTGYDSSITTLAIGSGGLKLVAGDVMQVEKAVAASYDNELGVISSITSDTVIVMKRGQAGSTAVDWTVLTNLTKVGNVFEEGSDAAAISNQNPTKYTNYCQIFKTAVGITNTAKLTYARTGDAFMNDKKRRAFQHATAIEQAIMFGQAYEDTTGSYPKRFTGGLREFITSNETIFATSPSENDFLDAAHVVFDYDANGAGNERLMIAGNGFLNALNKKAVASSASRINFDGVLDIFGMKLQKWVLPQGTLAIKTHPLMNTHSLYKDSAFIINPRALRYRYLRDTKFKDNIQGNGEDTRKGQWLTECGLEVNFEKTMAFMHITTT